MTRTSAHIAAFLAVTLTFAFPAEKEEVNSQMGLASMVPLNADLRDFRLPQRDEDGQTSSIIEIGVLRRTSDTHFFMQNLKIRLFENGIEVGTITTPQARFYMEHQLLAGRALVRIDKPGGKNPIKSTGRGFVYRLGSSKKVRDNVVIPAVPPIWSLLSEVTTTLQLSNSKSDRIPTKAKSSEKP